MNAPDPLLRQRCEALGELDLVRAVTLEREQNSAEFADEATAELERRGTSLTALIDRVRVRAGAAAESDTTIDAALALVHSDVPRGSVASFSNCLGPSVILQREGWGWVLHEYDDDSYLGSYLVHDTDSARALMEAFLRLQPWRDDAGKEQHLDNWKTVEASPDADTVQSLSDHLAAAGVTHIVRPTLFTPEGDASVALLVPSSQRKAAEDVIGRGQAAAQRLRQRLRELDKAGDLTAELMAYDELLEIDGDSHAAHYNRGAVLQELGRREEAAAAFMEAAALGLATHRPDLSLGKGPTAGGVLGLFGVAVRLAGRSMGTAARPSWPDWFEDVDLRLQHLLGELGPRADMLHSLASLARVRGETEVAVTHYRSILQLQPGDEVARFQLQYLAAAGD